MSQPKPLAPSDLPTFVMAEHLRCEDDVAQYLTLVRAEADPVELSRALEVVAQARRMWSNGA